jgi:hypothetical protein
VWQATQSPTRARYSPFSIRDLSGAAGFASSLRAAKLARINAAASVAIEKTRFAVQRVIAAHSRKQTAK